MSEVSNTPSVPKYVRDDREPMEQALNLARRLPLTGRKPSEYMLARGVLAYEAEVERLREALDGIAHWRGSFNRETAILLRDHARAALGEKP